MLAVPLPLQDLAAGIKEPNTAIDLDPKRPQTYPKTQKLQFLLVDFPCHYQHRRTERSLI